MPARAQRSGLVTTWPPTRCFAATVRSDADRDGIDDRCEHDLAAHFAPELLVDERDCLWDARAARLAGGYFYLVQRAGAGLRIAYLPAWLRDCGWRGFPRAIRFGRANAHDGDSELIVVDVEPVDGARWRTARVFLSAHCGGRSAGRCRWFDGRDLERFAWVDGTARGAPVVWVARDKHASYPTRDACESGHWRQERCARAPRRHRFPVLSPTQNVGSRAAPRHGAHGCIPASALSFPPGEGAVGEECIWDAGRPFRGWRAGPTSATPYAVVLRRVNVP